MEIKEIINERIKLLKNKRSHYVVNLGSIDEPKEVKEFHKAGKEKWCPDCIRIIELKSLLKKLKKYNGA